MLEAAGNLLAARQRSALALVGILIGAAAVIAMLNVGGIARNETIRQFRAMGTDVMTITVSSRSSNAVGLKRADVEAIPAVIPAVAEITPFVTGGGMVAFGTTSHNATFAGVAPEFDDVVRLTMQSGRFISFHDDYEAYCVLGARLASSLGGRGERPRVNAKIRVGAYIFTVIGIAAPAVQNPMLPLSVDDTMFVSLPNARRVMPGQIMGAAVGRLAPNASAEKADLALQAYLNPKLRDAYLNVQTARQLIAGMASQMHIYTLLLGAVGTLSLVLGGVGVMNIMLVSVAERKQEIGIRLAIGARRRDIRALFLSEAVILAVAGGLLGIVFGLAASWGFAWLSDWEFVLSPEAAPLGAGVSVLVGIFFGFYPAVSASRLDPIESLRAE